MREPADFIRDLAALGAAQRTVRLDQATGADALSRIVTRAPAARSTRGADPIAHDEGGQEPGRDRGRARGAAPRRRRGGALSRLVRPRGAARQAHRDRRGRGAGKLPPRHRPAQGRVVPDHLRRRAERRDRALPRHARDQPQDRAGRAVPDRLRRRSTRTAPPTSPAPSRSASRRAEMRERFTRVLKGHIAIARAVFPDGTTGAQLDPFARAGAVGGRPRLRPRHRPRRRQLSVGARGPGAHLQARQHRRSSAA